MFTAVTDFDDLRGHYEFIFHDNKVSARTIFGLPSVLACDHSQYPIKSLSVCLSVCVCVCVCACVCAYLRVCVCVCVLCV